MWASYVHCRSVNIRLLDPEMRALTMRPPRLPSNKSNVNEGIFWATSRLIFGEFYLEYTYMYFGIQVHVLSSENTGGVWFGLRLYVCTEELTGNVKAWQGQQSRHFTLSYVVLCAFCLCCCQVFCALSEHKRTAKWNLFSLTGWWGWKTCSSSIRCR